MNWLIMVLIMALCVMLVICYALMVTAHNADERAERMYRAWKEKDDRREEGADDE